MGIIIETSLFPKEQRKLIYEQAQKNLKYDNFGCHAIATSICKVTNSYGAFPFSLIVFFV